MLHLRRTGRGCRGAWPYCQSMPRLRGRQVTTSFVAVFVSLRVHSCSLGQCLRQKDPAWPRILVRCQVLCRRRGGGGGGVAEGLFLCRQSSPMQKCETALYRVSCALATLPATWQEGNSPSDRPRSPNVIASGSAGGSTIVPP